MLHQVGVSFDLYYDARKHKIKMNWQIQTVNLVTKCVALMKVKETMCATKFVAHDSSCLALTECLLLFRLCLSSAKTEIVETSCEEKHVPVVDSMQRGVAFVWRMTLMG